MPDPHQLLRSLPAVARLLDAAAMAPVISAHGLGLVTLVLRDQLDRLRAEIRAGSLTAVPGVEELAAAIDDEAARFTAADGRRAINATGILLHTGLGRAPLSAAAMAAIAACDRYSILQTDLESGGRSLRETKIERLLRALTGCDAATVVNNNAAATMLLLNTVGAGREVVISRGQLVEIGGAFRMPDVMQGSGCRMHEIGTTNRTHLRDYAAAIGEDTAALIHVHTSNYRVRGFSSTPDIRALAGLARERGVIAIDDLGSGALTSLREFGLPDEPLVRDSIDAGADACCFSGDKLICGPQCGIIVGRRELIARVRANPFARMFRVCKLTLAALEATLVQWVNDTWRDQLPFYRMVREDGASLAAAAEELRAAIGRHAGVQIAIEDDTSYVGSGSLPDQGLPTRVLVLRPTGAGPSLNELARRCRCGTPSLFVRVRDDAICCDLRTVAPSERPLLARRLCEVVCR